jgi:hypothetical protein
MVAVMMALMVLAVALWATEMRRNGTRTTWASADAEAVEQVVICRTDRVGRILLTLY